MGNKESDIFEGLNISSNDKNNFFISKEFSLFESTPVVSKPFKRLNDYDSKLLEEDSYKEIDDDLFKLEYRISKLETSINNIKSQIQVAKDLSDDILLQNCLEQKQVLENEYFNLIRIYQNKNLSTKISGKFFNKIDKRNQKFIIKIGININNVIQKLLDRLPNNIKTVLKLKKTLIILKNLNKSVDELVSLNIPYGEQLNKYEKL